ncbi:hypothetical protein NM688_g5389 [Phlebia brevispora]|uniref:Uncharacterized protein n=1 Tax=Phlebia brevispora TaxID=194682 RepID=A0ACC1SW27_9APHY|nr:hypothetical protein NM688_g5389 [Phlebia brevispora]
MISPNNTVLVTGGNGFIGGHLCRRLLADGYRVYVTDIQPKSYFPDVPNGIEVIPGDLRDLSFCRRVVEGMDTVVHLAATMGGMGTIHETNDFIIYHENHVMMTNILSASVEAGVKKFLYASSACVYHDGQQAAGNMDVSLREGDVYGIRPQPQGLYGLEKLHSELLLQLGAPEIDVRIARFHNIYGPHGCWSGGREKVPASLLRKLIAGGLATQRPFPLEIWGDGTQRRSFCYIDDAVEGVVRLLASDCREPLNIGSDRAVSINELAYIAADALDIAASEVSFSYVQDRPVGVGSRNSNNEKVREILGWEPVVTLEEGMARTGRWIKAQIDGLLHDMDTVARGNALAYLQTSQLVVLRPERIVFAVLLPVTSRVNSSGSSGAMSATNCLEHLQKFAASLLATTQEDVYGEGARFHIKVYLAIDHDDEALLQGALNRAEETLKSAGVVDVVTLVCNFPRGNVCSLWRDCARRAWNDGCDYFALMGDDVILRDANWLSAIHGEFAELARREGVPTGFGCVAFTDTSFPGMPTFPVVHRTHLDIFHGQVVPDVFVNQDGDPFLFQLYRRFGCSKMISSRIHNSVGGDGTARYEKQHAREWTFGTLDEATCVIESWLGPTRAAAVRRLTIDAVIPCYRVNMEYLDRFLALEVPASCSVMFIIIVDNPHSPNIKALCDAYGHRPDVRIRVNEVNSGASASRNRGIQESSAEWLHFLDDDVEPQGDLLVALEKRIRTYPDAAGFVGNALFPRAETVYSTAVHLAGVTYFWDIATKIEEDVPWGVTANLAARRNVRDGVTYDLIFPKTGGGEDIDYCRRKRQFSVDRGRRGFMAAPDVVVIHPYWQGGNRYYWRFYMWSKGDGALIKLYPDLVYMDYAPNSAELLLLSSLVTISVGGTYLYSGGLSPLLGMGPSMITAAVCANVLHDVYRHLWRDAESASKLNSSLTGCCWVLAVLESSFIRMFSEMGRLVGMLERGEFGLIGHRFDWFAGVWGDGPRSNERKNSVQRFGLFVLLVAVTLPLAHGLVG